MAIITNNAGLIITKGLGGTACCALITASFGLNCGCTVEIIVPPSEVIKAGGGPVGGFFVPLPKKLEQQTRMVLVTVKFSPEKTWRRSYIVHVNNADMIVKVINILNTWKDKLSIGVDKVKTVKRSVMAIFDK